MPVTGASATDFDAFTSVLQAPRTLRSTSKWLSRLDVLLCRAGVLRTPAADQLLRRLFPASRAPGAAQPPRFPARVVLCAWMVVQHPDWVLRDPGGALEVCACQHCIPLRLTDPVLRRSGLAGGVA